MTEAAPQDNASAEQNQTGPILRAAPRLATPPKAEPTFFSRLYDLLAWGGPLTLTLIFLAQTLPGLPATRSLWLPQELHQADILHTLLQGALYLENPPLYFGFLAGLRQILDLAGLNLGSDYAALLFTGTAAAGLLLIWTVFILASRTARLDRRGSFAAGCVLLSNLFLWIGFHSSGQDLLFAAFITLSMIFLHQGLIRPKAPVRMTLAFLWAGLALITKGWLGLGLPLISAVLFCFQQGRPLRLLKLDFLSGLVTALIPMLLWLGYVWTAESGPDLVMGILNRIRQEITVHDPAMPWWYYLAAFPLFWLPWSALPLLAPWGKIFGSGMARLLKTVRREENQGLAFIWIALLGSFALISILGHKEPAGFFPLLGPLAVVSGRAALSLSPVRGMLLQRWFAIFFLTLTAICIFLPVYFSGALPSLFAWLQEISLPAWPVKPGGVFILLVIFLAGTALCAGTVKARRPESAIIILPLILTLAAYPALTVTLPSLDATLDTKEIAMEIHRKEEQGYASCTLGLPEGIFSYYAEQRIPAAKTWEELKKFSADHPQAMLIIPRDALPESLKVQCPLPGFSEYKKFWLFSRECVLFLR